MIRPTTHLPSSMRPGSTGLAHLLERTSGRSHHHRVDANFCRERCAYSRVAYRREVDCEASRERCWVGIGRSVMDNFLWSLVEAMQVKPSVVVAEW